MPRLNLFSFSSWSLTGLTPTWKGQPLYDFVRTNGGAASLPEPPRGENEPGWAAGALDGVTSHRLFNPEGSEQQQRVTEVFRVLQVLLKHATGENLSALYAIVQREPLISSAEELQKMIGANLTKRYKLRILETGRYLATKGDERENVKFGILLIDLCGGDNDRPVLELLATHDEFTLFAAVAVARLAHDPERALFHIAKQVHGWGRVQVVERLSETRNRDIQAWMLREGFRNNIMDEYLVGICAKTGRLHEALRSPYIDSALLDGAADTKPIAQQNGLALTRAKYTSTGSAKNPWSHHPGIVCCSSRREIKLTRS